MCESTLDHNDKRGIIWHGFCLIHYMYDNEAEDVIRYCMYPDQILSDSNEWDIHCAISLLTGYLPHGRLLHQSLQKQIIFYKKSVLCSIGSFTHLIYLFPNYTFSNTYEKKQDFVIVKADKNLGPCVIETDKYIKYALEDHLNCQDTYKKLSTISAKKYMETVDKKIRFFLYKHRKILSTTETKYLRKKTKECTDPFPKLYLLMKVHKTPLKTRPVVSCSGGLLHPLGVWLNTALQPIATKLTSFIASSYNLKEALKTIHGLPAGAKLFTADTVNMYTNIDTPSAIT